MGPSSCVVHAATRPRPSGDVGHAPRARTRAKGSRGVRVRAWGRVILLAALAVGPNPKHTHRFPRTLSRVRADGGAGEEGRPVRGACARAGSARAHAPFLPAPVRARRADGRVKGRARAAGGWAAWPLRAGVR